LAERCNALLSSSVRQLNAHIAQLHTQIAAGVNTLDMWHQRMKAADPTKQPTANSDIDNDSRLSSFKQAEQQYEIATTECKNLLLDLDQSNAMLKVLEVEVDDSLQDHRWLSN